MMGLCTLKCALVWSTKLQEQWATNLPPNNGQENVLNYQLLRRGLFDFLKLGTEFDHIAADIVNVQRQKVKGQAYRVT